MSLFSYSELANDFVEAILLYEYSSKDLGKRNDGKKELSKKYKFAKRKSTYYVRTLPSS